MARIMTLDGPRIAEIRAKLDGVQPSWWRSPVRLGDAVVVLRTHGMWIAGVLGAIAGAAISASRRR